MGTRAIFDAAAGADFFAAAGFFAAGAAFTDLSFAALGVVFLVVVFFTVSLTVGLLGIEQNWILPVDLPFYPLR